MPQSVSLSAEEIAIIVAGQLHLLAKRGTHGAKLRFELLHLGLWLVREIDVDCREDEPPHPMLSEVIQ